MSGWTLWRLFRRKNNFALLSRAIKYGLMNCMDRGKNWRLILFMMIAAWETFSVVWEELVRSAPKGTIWGCLGDCVSNLRGNLVFFEHISKLLISSLTQEKGNCCLFFFHPQTTVDPKKRPHFQTLALKVLLPTTSKPVKWEEEEWRINDEIKREKTVEPNADWQTLVLGSG